MSASINSVFCPFWAKVAGLGQIDLRLFSEGSTTNNDPLFNLGTQSTGASGQLDVFLRQAGWTAVNHILTEAEPLNDEWHHIAFIQQIADGELCPQCGYCLCRPSCPKRGDR